MHPCRHDTVAILKTFLLFLQAYQVLNKIITGNIKKTGSVNKLPGFIYFFGCNKLWSRTFWTHLKVFSDL